MEQKIIQELKRIFSNNNWNFKDINVSKPTNIEFGEFSSNVALIHSKELSLKPSELATLIIEQFDKEKLNIKEIKVMGPGFINFYLDDQYYANIVKTICENESFGSFSKNGLTINNEYVSANPTGFLHIAHARGAALGDSLCNILEYAGYNVVREYYINDAGNQIDRLAISTYVRYHQELGIDMELPEDSYRGSDITWGAQQIIKKYGTQFLNVPYEQCRDQIKQIASSIMLDQIKVDLKNLGVEFNIWFSEKSLYTDKLIDNQLKTLKGIYDKDGAKWLETSKLGDDKDRVLLKANGEGTYFLSDTVYHMIKANREPKPSILIDIWGADHVGYIKRVETALQLQGFNTSNFTVITIQLVKLIKEGKEMKMSKRKGTSLFMSELVEQVGKDTVRFFLVNRSPNSSIDFDIDLANLKTNDNPAFIVQYAHARICQLISKSNLAQIDVNHLMYQPSEYSLISLMNKFPELIKQISENYKVHLLPQYLIDLAREYNSFYSNSKIIGTDRENDLIALSKACGQIIKNGLKLIGVSAPERM